MGTNRQKRKRTSNSTMLDDSIEEFFYSGNPPRDSPGWSLRISRFFVDSCDEILTVWLEHRDFLLSKWLKEKRSGLSWAEQKYENIP